MLRRPAEKLPQSFMKTRREKTKVIMVKRLLMEPKWSKKKT